MAFTEMDLDIKSILIEKTKVEFAITTIPVNSTSVNVKLSAYDKDGTQIKSFTFLRTTSLLDVSLNFDNVLWTVKETMASVDNVLSVVKVDNVQIDNRWLTISFNVTDTASFEVEY